MTWQVGDPVQLTPAGVMQLARDNPDAFAKLSQAGTTAGQIAECLPDSVKVQFGEPIGEVCVASPEAEPHKYLQATGAGERILTLPLSAIGPMLFGPPQVTVPLQVGTAQWVVSQFLELRKFSVLQTVQRNAQLQDGDEWKTRDATTPDALLLRAERQLYEAAMRRVQEWVSSPSVPTAGLAGLPSGLADSSLLSDFAAADFTDDDYEASP